jgi:hypothetical protein
MYQVLQKGIEMSPHSVSTTTQCFLAWLRVISSVLAMLMTMKKSIKWAKAIHDPLNSVVTNIARAPGHQFDPQSAEGHAFQSYFYDPRNANRNEVSEKYGQTVRSMPYDAFYLALVKERFVTANMGTPDWRRVFDSIAE